MFIKKHGIFLAICLIALIIKFVLAAQPTSPWWDPAIYVGMGKYLFSSGMFGLWEILRPPLWPIILGEAWSIGLEPLAVAKVLVIASSLATLVVLYVLGEKYEKGVGLTAAILLATSPIHNFFVTVPTNDIPSTLLSLLAVYTILQKRYTLSGLLAGLAFLTRFPHALFMAPLGLFIVIEEWPNFKSTFKKGLALTAGFAAIVIPYFILNYIMYQDALLPIKLGRSIIEGNPDQSPFFYIFYLIADNPLILLSLVGIIVFIISIIKTRKKPEPLFTLSFLCLLIVGTYLSQIGHKELRYAFPFQPYILLFAGLGLSYLWNLAHTKKRMLIAVSVIIVLGFTNLFAYTGRAWFDLLSKERHDYYAFVPPKARTLTTAPQIMLFSDAKVVGVFDSWENGSVWLQQERETLEYVSIDDCQIFCRSGNCEKQKTAFFNALALGDLQYQDSDREGKCTLSVYKLR